MKSEELLQIQRLLDDGTTPELIASWLGIHYTTLLRRLNTAGYKIERESTYRLIPLERVLMPDSELSEAVR